MDGFYREVHTSQGKRTGVVECAVSIHDTKVTSGFKNVQIPHFRKVYDRKQNTDQFIETKEGHNHLLLLLNDGINLVPIGKRYKSSVWSTIPRLEKTTWFDDRLVYVLSSKRAGWELKLLIDADDYAIYKNELIREVGEFDHEHYAWQRINTDGEKCGAIIDHQSYEYRRVNGKMYPHYFFRSFDFRCFNLNTDNLSSVASFTTELLINKVSEGIDTNQSDRFKKKQGLINRKEPYDSLFWKHFNDIQDVTPMDELPLKVAREVAEGFNIHLDDTPTISDEIRTLKIGDHATHSFTRVDSLYGSLSPLLTCYDVVHYDLTVDVNPRKEWIQGASIITFTVLEATEKIRLDLLEYLKIDSILFKGQVLSFKRDADAVYVVFPEKLLYDKTYQVKIAYEGHPLDMDFDKWTGGFMWVEDQNGQPFAQSLCQGYGPKAWWPVKNHLSDEPDSVNIHISVPSNLTTVSNGTLMSHETENEKTTYHWLVKSPINNYNIAVHIWRIHESNPHP